VKKLIPAIIISLIAVASYAFAGAGQILLSPAQPVAETPTINIDSGTTSTLPAARVGSGYPLSSTTGTTEFADGTTAYTQFQGDNSVKLATTEYTDTGLATKITDTTTPIGCTWMHEPVTNTTICATRWDKTYALDNLIPPIKTAVTTTEGDFAYDPSAHSLLLSYTSGTDTFKPVSTATYSSTTWNGSTYVPDQNSVRDEFENRVAKVLFPWKTNAHRDSPVSGDVLRFRTDKVVTLSSIGCIVDPEGSSESVSVDFQECNGDGDSCSSVLSAAIVCGNTNTTGTISDTSLAANTWSIISFGTVTGTVSNVSVYIRGTEAQ